MTTVTFDVDRTSSAFQPLIMFLTSMSIIHQTRIPCRITSTGLTFQSNNEMNSLLADVYFPSSSFSSYNVSVDDDDTLDLALFSAPSLHHAFLNDKSSIESLSFEYCKQEDRLVWKIKQTKHEVAHEVDVRLYDLQNEFQFFDVASKIDVERFDVVAQLKSSELNDALALVKNCHDKHSDQHVEIELKSERDMWFITHSDYLHNAKIHVPYEAQKFALNLSFYFRYLTCKFLHHFSNIMSRCTFYFRSKEDSPCVVYFDEQNDPNSPRFCVVVSAVVKEEDENEDEDEDRSSKRRKRN